MNSSSPFAPSPSRDQAAGAEQPMGTGVQTRGGVGAARGCPPPRSLVRFRLVGKARFLLNETLGKVTSRDYNPHHRCPPRSGFTLFVAIPLPSAKWGRVMGFVIQNTFRGFPGWRKVGGGNPWILCPTALDYKSHNSSQCCWGGWEFSWSGVWSEGWGRSDRPLPFRAGGKSLLDYNSQSSPGGSAGGGVLGVVVQTRARRRRPGPRTREAKVARDRRRDPSMAAAEAPHPQEEEEEEGEDQDPELEELLASALDDFDKAKPAPLTPPSAATAPTAPENSNAEKSPGDAAKDALFASQEKFFQDLFDSELASQATAEFEKAMQELAEEEPHLVEQFQKLSEAAGRVGSDPSSQQEFTSCLRETLSGLAKNANDLQNSGVCEEELAKTMEGLGLEDGEGEGTLLPLMQSIMQNLLSKDVLYPSLKEITEKYPEWLQRHREALPKEQYEKYQEQHSIMGQICRQFEAEQPTDGEGEHKARFEAILDLMQQLQDLGHPPKELAGESPPGLNFDLEGLNLPEAASAGGDQCGIM